MNIELTHSERSMITISLDLQIAKYEKQAASINTEETITEADEFAIRGLLESLDEAKSLRKRFADIFIQENGLG